MAVCCCACPQPSGCEGQETVTGWLEFSVAYAAFFLTHSLPVRPPLRPLLQATLGPSGFTLAYSAISLAALASLIGAAGTAPFVPPWDWAPWQIYVPLTVMLPVCVILSLAIARPNPFSFGGARTEMFDPARPGIVRVHRHRFRWPFGPPPMRCRMAIWRM